MSSIVKEIERLVAEQNGGTLPEGLKGSNGIAKALSHLSGAGGGSGGGGALLLVITSNGDGTYNSNYDFATVSAAIENDTGVFGVYSYDKSCGPIGEIFMSDGSVQMREISNGPVQLTWLEETGIREPV